MRPLGDLVSEEMARGRVTAYCIAATFNLQDLHQNFALRLPSLSALSKDGKCLSLSLSLSP
jgi:uncharacterized Rmd1/YagE family protein